MIFLGGLNFTDSFSNGGVLCNAFLHNKDSECFDKFLHTECECDVLKMPFYVVNVLNKTPCLLN